MDKKNIAIIAVILVLALGTGAYFFLGKKTTSTNTNGENMAGNVTSDNGSFSGTLKDLILSGKNYNCTYNMTDEGGNKLEGEVFVASSGNKLSGQFTNIQPDGTTTVSNMISDGEYTYTWTPDTNKGYKIKINPEDNSLYGTGDNTQNDQAVNENQNIDYNCHAWVVDNSKFTPPTNVEFTDTSEMMQKAQEAQEKAKDSIDCSVCDQVPAGSARDQCLSNLGC